MSDDDKADNDKIRHAATALLATERFEALEARLIDINHTFTELLKTASETKATLEFHIKEENFQLLTALEKQEETRQALEHVKTLVDPVLTDRRAIGTIVTKVRNLAAFGGALAVLAGGLVWLWERLRELLNR